MKTTLASLVLCLATSVIAMANTAPTPVVVSATMRPGTTLMDVVYRVNDPDDATVKVRALAFINGERSFAKVIRPVTFLEGTAVNVGDAITTNAEHTLTWDVAADWSIDVGQLKFEILALDGRGLLQFDWITIPAAASQPALTISKDTPADNKVLDALFWQYASGDTGLSLASGVLSGTSASGEFLGLRLASGNGPAFYGAPYVFKKMNLDPASAEEVTYANVTARAGLLNTASWHAANRPYYNTAIDIVIGWGFNSSGQVNFYPIGSIKINSIAAGSQHSLVLKSNGTVVGWGRSIEGQITIPTGLSGVTAIAAGGYHSLALKSDGTIIGWGSNAYGQITIPTGLSGVTAIAAGNQHSIALKSDGTVVVWGDNGYNQTMIPAGLSGVSAISAGYGHNLARKNDGTVVGWGYSYYGQSTIPSGLSGVTAIAAGGIHSLALKSDGTVVAWGTNTDGQTTIPVGLSGVSAIAAGGDHSLALKSDGTVVGWGRNTDGQTTIPAGLSGVMAIAAGGYHSLALKPKAP
jgi:hypothetical protein